MTLCIIPLGQSPIIASYYTGVKPWSFLRYKVKYNIHADKKKHA